MKNILGKTALASLIAVLALFSAGPAMANLITNGTFDTSVPSNGTGGGWTSSHIDGAGGWFSAGGNPGAMFILNDAGQVGSDPNIYQDVSGLAVGDIYRLTGDYANHHGAWGSLANGLGIDIVSGATTWHYEYPWNGQNVWDSFLIDFTAQSTTVRVLFAAEINGGDRDYKIDNISLVRIQQGGGGSVIPEPSTMILLGAGLVGLGYWKRRSGRK